MSLSLSLTDEQIEEAAFHAALVDAVGDIDDAEIEVIKAEIARELAEKYPAYKLPAALAALVAAERWQDDDRIGLGS